MSNKVIELIDVHKTYQMGETEVYAVRGVSFSIEQGDFIAIMGHSGSGKSTLLNLLGLLDVPDKGTYNLLGKDVSKLKEDELAISRRKTIGFVFQQFNLLPRMTALQNVALPMLYTQYKIDNNAAQKYLDQVGLGNRALHKPTELSGGQQQRVAIARSLINEPNIILADEPTGNLDSTSKKEIITILKDLNKKGITIILVTHEDDIAAYANRIVKISDGKIISDERNTQLIETKEISSSNKEVLQNKNKIITEVVEHFKQGVSSLYNNKVRTALSMLGILIGVAAVVAMLALGNGATMAIKKELASLGSNLLVLRTFPARMGGIASASGGSSIKLRLDDVAIIKEKIYGVKDASPSISGRGQVTYQNKNCNTQVLGAVASYAPMHASIPTEGRFFTEEENKTKSRVAVLGRTVIRELFDDRNPIGEFIKINRINFQIIGVLPERGSTGFRDQDDIIIIPVLTAMYRVFGKNHVDSIEIEVMDAQSTETIQEDILQLMFSVHKIPISQQNEAMEIRDLAELQATLSKTSNTMSILLSAIAAISLLVGGIGIMNIMLVSVTERTKEIGLRKAVGARRQDIILQFIIETVVISTTGGLLGIFFGWLITTLLSSIAGWNTYISLNSVLLSFIFSASIGIIFGIYPAQKAANMNPIEALRYE